MPSDHKHPLPKIDAKIRHAFHHNLMAWYQKEKRPLPWRFNPTPYAITVSEFMCQQTQIATVLPYYDRWMKKFPNWQSLAQADESAVIKLWEGLGYYRRARALHALAKTITQSQTGELPNDPLELKKLSGIGPYTAGAIASIAFGQRAALVDGNVERVFARVFNLKWDIKQPASRKKMAALAETLLPEKNCGNYNQSLMELGARICSPRKPACLLCPLQTVCLGRTHAETLPVKSREASIRESETWAWITQGEKIWLELPENPRRWKGFYRIPLFKPKLMKSGKELHHLRYTITKYLVNVKIISAKFIKTPTHGKWFNHEELESLSLPSPHRKAVQTLGLKLFQISK